MKLALLAVVSCTSCSASKPPQQPRDPSIGLYVDGKLHTGEGDRFTCSATRVEAESCRRRDASADCLPIAPPGHWTYGGCGGARSDEARDSFELAAKPIPVCVCSCDQQVIEARARADQRAQECAKIP